MADPAQQPAETSPTRFHGASYKLTRGWRHILDLEQDVTRYLKEDPGGVLIEELKGQPVQRRAAMRLASGLPPDLALTAGDAVHNLRVALDHLANDLATVEGGRAGKVYFPFADSAEGFEDQLRRKCRGLPDWAVDAFRALRPYRGGNEDLRALHDLDIADKHRTILALGHKGQTAALPLRPVGYERIGGERPNRLTIGVDFNAIAIEPVPDGIFPDDGDWRVVGRAAGSTVEVVIASGLPLGGTPVVPTLKRLAHRVARIVEVFRAHARHGNTGAPGGD